MGVAGRALNTVVVAVPGVLGVIGRRLPIQDLLGFANQAIVLCAVARELGVTDHRRQARMLASVLCGRDLSVVVHDPGDSPMHIPFTPEALPRPCGSSSGGSSTPSATNSKKRPHPRAPPFRYIAMLPAVGVVASYLGEIGALSRAAKRGAGSGSSSNRRLLDADERQSGSVRGRNTAGSFLRAIRDGASVNAMSFIVSWDRYPAPRGGIERCLVCQEK